MIKKRLRFIIYNVENYKIFFGIPGPPDNLDFEDSNEIYYKGKKLLSGVKWPSFIEWEYSKSGAMIDIDETSNDIITKFNEVIWTSDKNNLQDEIDIIKSKLNEYSNMTMQQIETWCDNNTTNLPAKEKAAFKKITLAIWGAIKFLKFKEKQNE